MARKMTSDEYQELGRRYYKLKQYDEAVEAFTSGIELTPTLGLFDHRAAAYDRLQDYNAAVRDGREMIKLNKQDVKGYLRTASILEKMDKADTALGIYKYGMKNVPVSDKNFKLLQQLHDKTTRKLSPAKSVDPFTVLPVELAEMVLEYLAFRNLINSMRVSRGWRDYIAKLPRLWLHLDLSGARRPVPRKFIDKAVRRSENRLTRMTVHRFEHVDVLKNIAKACKSLTELELITLPHAMSSTLIDVVFHALKLEKFVVHPLITLDTVTRIMNARPTLKHVGFNAVRASSYPADWRNVYANLEICNMHFENRTQGATSSLVTLLGHTRMLKTLNTSQVTIAQNFLLPSPGLSPSPAYPLSLTTLVLRKAACSQFPVLVPTLQKVVIEYGGSGPSTSDTGLLRSRLPALTHLSLVDMNPFSHDRMEELLDLYIDDEGHIKELENAVPLQSLTLDAVLANPELGLFKAATGLFLRSPRILTPALQHLNIATLPCTDDEVEQLLTHDTGLVSINLSHTQITGASIKMLADALPNLKSIKADYCPRISGRDAIEYAKRKGVAVSCSMDESKGSRKVRYG